MKNNFRKNVDLIISGNAADFINASRETRLKGDFGYAEMLSINNPFYPEDNDLNALAEFMASRIETPDSDVQAGYTYLSQFIDHDIALDSKNREFPQGKIDPATVINKRNPSFDLETIYGFDAPSNQGEIARSELLQTKALLKLGWTNFDITSSVKKSFPNDLFRKPDSPTAHIVDERNDENLAIAQTQVAFIKFHNAIVAHLGGADTTALFEKAREIAIRHYQWIILRDFLPKIIKESVLRDVLDGGNKLYFPEPNNIFMPLEFSVAAFRAGHSMVRNSYQWNDLFNDARETKAALAQLRIFTGSGGMSGKKSLPSDWIINWNNFYEIDDSSIRRDRPFSFAKKTDCKISSALGLLRIPPISFKRENSLPALDLYRTRALGLPTGQAVAAEVASRTAGAVLDSRLIADLLPTQHLKDVFSSRTPLWFYILAEAEINEEGRTLGDVGSRLVAETFAALLKASEFSILKKDLASDKEFLGTDGKFGMPEMLKFIRSKNREFDELNPAESVSL